MSEPIAPATDEELADLPELLHPKVLIARIHADAAKIKALELERDTIQEYADQVGANLTAADGTIKERDTRIAELEQIMVMHFITHDDDHRPEGEQVIQALDGEVSEFAQSFESVRRILELKAETEALKAKMARLPADWDEDSSLRTWFPFTAQELEALKAERDALKAESVTERGYTDQYIKRLHASEAEVARLEGLIVRAAGNTDDQLIFHISEEARAIKARQK